MKNCPFCAEEIQDTAIVCKHCGRVLTTPPAAKFSAPKRRIKTVIAGVLLLALGAYSYVTVQERKAQEETEYEADAAARYAAAMHRALVDSIQVEINSGRMDTLQLASLDPSIASEIVRPAISMLVDKSAIDLGSAQYLQYGVRLTGKNNCRLQGRVVGLAGGGKDVEVYVFTDDDLINWKNALAGPESRSLGLYRSGRRAATTLDVPLDAGSYTLVISNDFSLFTAKTIQAKAYVRCTNQA